MNLQRALDEAIENMRNGVDPSEKKERLRPLPEAQIMELKEAFDRYQTIGHRFKPSDIVMPRKDSPYREAGHPHIVLEVNENPSLDMSAEDNSVMHYGARLDIRVAVLKPERGGTFALAPFWTESWQYDLYKETRASEGDEENTGS